MIFNEVLKFVDDIVFDRTGKHLDSLQKAILRATWQGEKYSKVAQEYHCTKCHVGNVASNLWQLISKELNEKIHKSNFRAAMERYQVSNVSNYGNFRLCCTKRAKRVKITVGSPKNLYQRRHE